MSNKELGARDLSVLNLLFDPSQGEKVVKELPQTVNDEVDLRDKNEGDSELVLKSKALELEGVKLTESGRLDEALLKFNESIDVADQRPSPYNNRAQLFRFMEKEDLALADLFKAIDLSHDNYPLTKCRAYCQRGIIRRKLNEIEAARDDFNESAKLGSNFARQQLVTLNPYTQLCNQMVNKLLTDVK